VPTAAASWGWLDAAYVELALAARVTASRALLVWLAAARALGIGLVRARGDGNEGDTARALDAGRCALR
jgi:hypothetical protein